MSYKLKYTPVARDKLRELKRQIGVRNGPVTAQRIVSGIIKGIRSLQRYPLRGPSVQDMLGIHTDYRVLHIGYEYIFYKFAGDTVFVVDVYNERENIIQKMFGESLRTQESIDFWGE